MSIPLGALEVSICYVFEDSVKFEQGILSQEALTNDAVIPINQIGRIERGEINPSISTLHSIAHGLKLSLSELVDSI